MLKPLILGSIIGVIAGYGIASASYWYSPDNQENRAYYEYQQANPLQERDYFPPDYDGPVMPKNALPQVDGYNARRDGPVWLTAEGLG